MHNKNFEVIIIFQVVCQTKKNSILYENIIGGIFYETMEKTCKFMACT